MHRKAWRITGPAALARLMLAGLMLAGLMLAGLMLAGLMLAGLAVTGCSAAARPAPTAGPETFRGSSTNLAAIDSSSDLVAVTASGLVTGHGSISLADYATKSIIRLTGGTITMIRSKGTSHQGISTTCAVTFRDRGGYRITGGTGRYTRASGHGTATVTFTASVPRKRDGSCDTGTDDVTGARETFIATGPMRLR